ncbi:MAG: class I SAM-dependent methyltransferase [Anaerolineaceae bacterium]|nr:class I SAM-dependent methyltransferase [Anaerolineaceae bacterium]
MSDDRLDMFTQRYQSHDTPWDTGITPPEIVQIVSELPPGKALDLGCGTGTNLRFLLQHSWQVDGVDFVAEAVAIAQSKLAAFPPEAFTVSCWDVTRLDECDALRAPYDLVVDIGCGHGVGADKHEKYAQDIATLLKPGGTLMLFTHYRSAERNFGWSPDDVHRLFSRHFTIAWEVLNDDTTTGAPSGWYRMVKPV